MPYLLPQGSLPELESRMERVRPTGPAPTINTRVSHPPPPLDPFSGLLPYSSLSKSILQLIPKLQISAIVDAAKCEDMVVSKETLILAISNPFRCCQEIISLSKRRPGFGSFCPANRHDRHNGQEKLFQMHSTEEEG